jgi:hypothetical protein
MPTGGGAVKRDTTILSNNQTNKQFLQM